MIGALFGFFWSLVELSLVGVWMVLRPEKAVCLDGMSSWAALAHIYTTTAGGYVAQLLMLKARDWWRSL